MNDKIELLENWRWKMSRKLAEFINDPDDINSSELTALISSYRTHHDMKTLVQNTRNLA